MKDHSATRARNCLSPPNELKSIQRRLLRWYSTHRRELPWRENIDPYRIWISEIMLQQTRVATVIPHYQKFLRRFPSVRKLAAARESSVLAAWSGLGYYRRARMLHAAAKKIILNHAGRFPHRREQLSELPGIGRYTSAAIASIAFAEPAAVVDGNVRRLIQRLTGKPVDGEALWQQAGALICRKHPGDFNQAMMELGATVCLPQRPRCDLCPLDGRCVTRGPLEISKTPKRQTKKQIRYLLDRRNGLVFLVKRPMHASLMPGMWELPECPPVSASTRPILRLRHSITVTDFDVYVITGRAPHTASGAWVQEPRAARLPLTGLAAKILRAAGII